eukprot:CAMPEP_0202748070 /NCGR_PEP_ID=MMETSP1388-20130828/9467_1 /ASSEMBLY_ACC=CAM_ASM_000864 /TAXON_ID=37098 /ORGANISM="Isochrysis sp, Strain CCMP1244" /LENGTH=110 /DNA_ID=CAMNT_0049415469 /DNA_START=1 /DNA_END=329 /DNA_ORIENTATION=+
MTPQSSTSSRARHAESRPPAWPDLHKALESERHGHMYMSFLQFKPRVGCKGMSSALIPLPPHAGLPQLAVLQLQGESGSITSYTGGTITASARASIGNPVVTKIKDYRRT